MIDLKKYAPWLIVLALALFAGLTPVHADVATPAAENAFAATDANADGAINSEEYRLRVLETFVLLDEDGNGFLVIAETSFKSQPDFNRVDSDGDGKITIREYLVYTGYLFEIAEEREEDFVNQFFRIKQEFSNGLSAYYSHRDRNSQVDSDREISLSNREYTTDTFGIGYTNNYVTLRAEHSDTKSTEHSSETDIVSANCFWPLTSQTSFHGLVSQSWIESSGVNSRETSIFRAEGKIKTRLTRHLKLSGRAELRDKEDSDFGPTDGLRMGIALQYNRRALSVRAGWDSYFLERYNTERDASKFYIKLIRRF